MKIPVSRPGSTFNHLWDWDYFATMHESITEEIYDRDTYPWRVVGERVDKDIKDYWNNENTS